jgi:aminoglycoside phosphotransferase (APT) family kinase protein
MTETAGRFTEGAMTQALRQIGRQLNISTDDAQLLGLTNNAVFALPAKEMVIRIARSHRLHDRAHKVARLATWFAAVNAPTIRPVSGLDQPLRVGQLLATAWHYVPPTLPAPTVEELGATLHDFHNLGVPPFPLPPWDPVADARSRLADAEALADKDRDALLAWCDRLQPQIAALTAQLPSGLVHGDAHVGNLLRKPNSRVILCDFDATCVGPWQVDLAAIAVGQSRFGGVGEHAALAESYGYDVTTDINWPVFREARELKMIVAAVPLLNSAPGVAQEFRIRLSSIMDGDQAVQWTPFADLRRG